MQCKSVSTINPDSYEAGSELGEALNEMRPEAVIVFASVRYDFAELLEGLADALAGSSGAVPVIVGGTGDGVYEASRVSNHGVAALGIHTGGRASFTCAVRPDPDDAYAAARSCAEEVAASAPGAITLALLFADLSMDGAKLVDGVQSVLRAPLIGGLTADDWNFVRSYVFCGRAVYERAIVILGISGDLAFAVGTASGWRPTGKLGVVDGSNGALVQRIDGKAATDFIHHQFGMSPAQAELGMVPLAIYQDPDQSAFSLRAPSRIDSAAGEVAYFGSIPPGAKVRVCSATRSDVLGGVDDAMRSLLPLPFAPAGFLVISCGARKMILGERFRDEVERVYACFGRAMPMIGLPSYGEIGPSRDDAGALMPSTFHNVTFVLLALGLPA